MVNEIKMRLVFLCVVSFCVVHGYTDDLAEIEDELALQPFERLKRVLVCLNQDARDQLINDRNDLRPSLLNQNYDTEFRNEAECLDEIKKDHAQPRTIAAIVAPKPFEYSTEIPMYFYDTPFLEEEYIEAFPNALTSVKHEWPLLKHVFVHYITRNQWKRIAIVSDYSNYSAAFEAQLVEEFERNEIVYDVQHCVVTEYSSCDFKHALTFLKKSKAVVIIANVDSRNALMLSYTAQKLQMKSRKYLWLMRDWPFEDTSAQNFNHIYSITVSPVCKYGYYKKPHYNRIFRGLLLISRALAKVNQLVANGNFKSDLDFDIINKFYRTVFKEMTLMTDAYYYRNHYAEAFIREFINDRPEFIKLRIYGNGYISPGAVRKDILPVKDLAEVCLLRSESYTSPCHDTMTVLICVVWLMFILMVFVLVFFFNRCLIWT